MDVFAFIQQHSKSLEQQAAFLRCYMEIFEVLLLFIRASREENTYHLVTSKLKIFKA